MPHLISLNFVRDFNCGIESSAKKDIGDEKACDF